MQITFVSNYINHHQIPVSNELYRLSDGHYTFIQTEPMEEERIQMGWDVNALKKPYVKLYYECPEECEALIMQSDCVIFGGTKREELIIPRLEAGKFTIRYSERLYKDGRWKFISPRGLKKKYHDHVRFNNSDVYLLCAGAYVKGDFNLIHAYPGKMLKYGYFPEFIEYTDLHELRRGNSKTEILWAARFIDWKHPEIMTKLAKNIKDKNLNAHITMIGNGPLFEQVKLSAVGLEEVISFAESKTPTEVRKSMQEADIFISTSDRKEGWGAVVNEAMNSGCVTIAAKDIGAAPYLIKDGVNGFTYKACDDKKLFEIVKTVMSDKDRQLEVATEGYTTIRTLWNPCVAADRLWKFINTKKINAFEEGPLSRA